MDEFEWVDDTDWWITLQQIDGIETGFALDVDEVSGVWEWVGSRISLLAKAVSIFVGLVALAYKGSMKPRRRRNHSGSDFSGKWRFHIFPEANSASSTCFAPELSKR